MINKKKRGNKQRESSHYKRHFVCSLALLFFLLSLVISSEITTTIHTQNLIEKKGVYLQKETAMETKIKRYLVREKVLDWIGDTQFDSYLLNTGGIIQLNFTVLPCSNSSVYFEYHFSLIWDPQPENFTLAPGESYAETYTFEWSGSGVGELVYTGFVLTEGANATVRWWYKVLKKGPNLELLLFFRTGWWLILLVGLPIVSIIVVLIILFARGEQKKNERSLNNEN